MAFDVYIIPAVLIVLISTLTPGTATRSPGNTSNDLLIPGTAARSPGYKASDLSFTVTIAHETFELSVTENGTNVTLPVGALPIHTDVDVSVEIPSPVPVPSCIRIENRMGTDKSLEHLCNQSRLCETRIQFIKAKAESLTAEILVLIEFDDQSLETIQVSKPILIEGNIWSTRPGNMSVLENTNVVFNWTYTFLEAVYIKWDYMGTEDDARFVALMTLDQNNLYTRPGNWSSRIEYVNFTGSAVMTMSNTTSADSGLYKVQVADVYVKFPAIRHSVLLTVVPESNLAFSIKVANMTFDLSVADNGTDVTLPDVAVTLPAMFDVRVKIVQTAPRPSVIGIQHRMGSMTDNTSCEQNRSCGMRHDFNQAKTEDYQTDIVININFEIQNLPPISIMGTVDMG